MSCQICLDDYKGRMKPITCQYCPSNACRKCLEQYLLHTYEDPHCVTCKRGWTPEFMAANFTLAFRGTELRKHRRQILFEREKSFLPSMQVYVEAKRTMVAAEAERVELYKGYRGADSISERFWSYMQSLNVLRSNYSAKKIQILNVKTQIDKVTDNKTGETKETVEAAVAGLNATLGRLRVERDALKKNIDELKEANAGLVADHTAREEAINAVLRRIQDAHNIYQGAVANTVKREFIMKCGAEECRGFLSTAYKCGVCDVWTCPDCLVVLGKDKNVSHECKPDMVESAKAIKAETQPCPKCAARIFKVDGCDQMWCTVEGCNTAFSWKTGHVVTGVVHNPHYYEWLRRNGGGLAREAGDIPCGGLPNYWTLLQAFRTARILPTESVQLELVHRNLVEFGERLTAFPARMPQLLNKEINVDYLMNKITEAEWKRQLEFTEAKFNRKKEIGQILQTLVTAGADLMNQVANRCHAATSKELQIDLRIWLTDTVLPELEGLRTYTNQAFKDLAVRNHMAVPQVADDWQWIPIRALYRKKKAGETVAEFVPEPVEEVT
jgi:hypothetical protein